MSGLDAPWSRAPANRFKGRPAHRRRSRGNHFGVLALGRHQPVRLRLIVTMPANHSHVPPPRIRIRKAANRDFDALMALEQRVFTTDRLSARSLRHFLHSPTAAMIVAEEGGELAGTAIVLFRSGTRCGAALFHRGGATDGRPGRGATAVAGRRAPGPRARLPHRAPRSAPHQCRRNLALSQGRLRRVRALPGLLRGWRRRLAFREAAAGGAPRRSGGAVRRISPAT